MYFTDNIEKAKVAKQLELRVIIINRDDKHYSTEDMKTYNIVRSLADIDFYYKDKSQQ